MAAVERQQLEAQKAQIGGDASRSSTQVDSEQDAPEPTSKSYVWKVPKGGERDRQAVCYWAGPFMSNAILANPAADLKPVPKEKIRDGSVPQMTKPEEGGQGDGGWRDEAHVPDQRPDLAHLNAPVHGQIVQERIPFHFVHPGLFDRKIRVIFEPAEDIAEKPEQHIIDLESFGNQFKKTIDRPEGMRPGLYNLTVYMLEGEEHLKKVKISVTVDVPEQ